MKAVVIQKPHDQGLTALTPWHLCRINTHWGGVTESNAFGTHEFFDLCAMIGAVSTEP